MSTQRSPPTCTQALNAYAQAYKSVYTDYTNTSPCVFSVSHTTYTAHVGEAEAMHRSSSLNPLNTNAVVTSSTYCPIVVATVDNI